VATNVFVVLSIAKRSSGSARRFAFESAHPAAPFHVPSGVTTIATAAPESFSASFWSSRIYVGRSSVGGVACEQAASAPAAVAAAMASAIGWDVTRQCLRVGRHSGERGYQ
jgi:hypothetical protein